MLIPEANLIPRKEERGMSLSEPGERLSEETQTNAMKPDAVKIEERPNKGTLISPQCAKRAHLSFDSIHTRRHHSSRFPQLL